MVAASLLLTGSPTLESTLVASERVSISESTELLNLEAILIILSTYSLLAASRLSIGSAILEII